MKTYAAGFLVGVLALEEEEAVVGVGAGSLGTSSVKGSAAASLSKYCETAS